MSKVAPAVFGYRALTFIIACSERLATDRVECEISEIAFGGATSAVALPKVPQFAGPLGVWCGRGDSNPHDIAIASPSSWCVCQFRHFRDVRGRYSNSTWAAAAASSAAWPATAAAAPERPVPPAAVPPT